MKHKGKALSWSEPCAAVAGPDNQTTRTPNADALPLLCLEGCCQLGAQYSESKDAIYDAYCLLCRTEGESPLSRGCSSATCEGRAKGCGTCGRACQSIPLSPLDVATICNYKSTQANQGRETNSWKRGTHENGV